MDQRVQYARRAQSLVMDAEQLDRQDSMARRDNKRVENRLRLEKGSLENHRSTNMYSLNHEMRRLKRELKGIKQTSGHFDLGSSKTSRAPRRGREKRARGYSETRRQADREVDGDANNPVTRHKDGSHGDRSDERSSEKNALVLPVLSGSFANKTSAIQRKEESSLSTNTAEVKPNTERSPRTGVNVSEADQIAKNEESRESDIKRGGHPPEIETVPKLKSTKGSDPSLGNLKMDAVKERIQHRLSTTNQVSLYQDEPDYTPFMHVPPDGLPRTVYLLPPLQDLLKEAKKARYIRRPKGYYMEKDDPERELDIDEIFGKKG